MNKVDYKNRIQEEQSYYKRCYANFLLGVLYNNERYYEGRYLYHFRWSLYYLKQEKEANGRVKRIAYKLLRFYHRSIMNKISYKTGFQFGMCDVGFGVKFHHFGSIVINGNVKIGKNLTIYHGVTIGQTAGNKENVPTIGNNVFIYPNAMVCGKISIGNNVTILANSVVTHDVPDDVVVGGIPAKIITKNYRIC